MRKLLLSGFSLGLGWRLLLYRFFLFIGISIGIQFEYWRIGASLALTGGQV